MAEIRIKAGRAKPLWRGHPWVFADSIARVEGSTVPGDLVTVLAPDYRAFGRVYYSPGSDIAALILVRDEDTPVDGGFFRQRLES